MLDIVRNALGPALFPIFVKQEIMRVSQTSEPIDPRAPLVQPAAVNPEPAATKE